MCIPLGAFCLTDNWLSRKTYTLWLPIVILPCQLTESSSGGSLDDLNNETLENLRDLRIAPGPGRQQCSASDEVWGYVDVRDGAHMFWWLYYADSPAAAHQHLPLVMWLQVQSASVLFVDNPVGTGFSYVDKSDGYAKDVATVASDMLVLLRSFFTERKEFQNVPFYIFSESYGGKMAAAISLELTKHSGLYSALCGLQDRHFCFSPFDLLSNYTM
ncbi:hypothetical protein CRUP_015281 [Coryphaenoides rupestris]|nr:hypothetical protein CRUP_015281 [Coryphaenoides rupestris]